MNTELNSSALQDWYLAAELCRCRDYNTTTILGLQYFYHTRTIILEVKGGCCWHVWDAWLLALASPKICIRRGRNLQWKTSCVPSQNKCHES